MTVTELDNLPRVNLVLGEYLKHTKLTIGEALLKQGRKLSFAVSRRMRRFAPSKGSIRREREGKGVRIRESLRQQKQGRKSPRERELSMRESARGYLAYATRVPMGGLRKGGRVKHVSRRYGQLLAEAGLRFNEDSQLLEIAYGSDRAQVGDVLAKPRYARAVNAALLEVAEDIEAYLDRKLK